ncbi:hypothetical protein [Chromobacterium violaceum]|uniref:hypothetical protein n=1 Tax=Chromobacterium violaceum TaxID=536 RepID=UPI00143D12B0|nr:hypothetical protein [Chromobacterium violaceum]QIY78340.1 hypothetical protein FOB43_03560 [Chromobacterium violaceum]
MKPRAMRIAKILWRPFDMTILNQYGKEITSLLVPLLTWTLNNISKRGVKLIASTPHRFTYLVNQPLIDKDGTVIKETQNAETLSYLIQNEGTETAKNVEVVFNWEPMCLNIWPQRKYTATKQDHNRYILNFDSLSPGEYISCEVLSVNQKMPEVITVRCEQSMAKYIEMRPQRVVPNYIINFIVLLCFMGIGAAIYLLIVILQFLTLNTPPIF